MEKEVVFSPQAGGDESCDRAVKVKGTLYTGEHVAQISQHEVIDINGQGKSITQNLVPSECVSRS